jgi:uncharacterized membrane protein YdbT with pleckstrin-like domain
MSYAESLLATDERILYRGRQHWLAPLADARNAVLLVLAGLVLWFLAASAAHPEGVLWQVWGGLAAILAIVGLAWIGKVYLEWKAEEYLITNRRVIKTEGLIDKKEGDSSLEKINDAVLKQGILGRLLKYGDLEILTANEDAIDRYTMLGHVVDFKKAMLNAKNDLDDGIRRPVAGDSQAAAPVAAAPAAPARQTSADDVATTLAKLADLRDKGAITPADYEAKKAELLGRI